MAQLIFPGILDLPSITPATAAGVVSQYDNSLYIGNGSSATQLNRTVAEIMESSPADGTLFTYTPASPGMFVLNAVIDGATTGGTATITVGANPNGVWGNVNTNTIYVANVSSGTVSVIDGATNAVTATITVGTNPYGVWGNVNTNTIYVANYGSGTVSVIGLGAVLSWMDGDGVNQQVAFYLGRQSLPFSSAATPITLSGSGLTYVAAALQEVI